MALNTSKYNDITPLRFKGLIHQTRAICPAMPSLLPSCTDVTLTYFRTSATQT